MMHSIAFTESRAGSRAWGGVLYLYLCLNLYLYFIRILRCVAFTESRAGSRARGGLPSSELPTYSLTSPSSHFSLGACCENYFDESHISFDGSGQHFCIFK